MGQADQKSALEGGHVVGPPFHDLDSAPKLLWLVIGATRNTSIQWTECCECPAGRVDAMPAFDPEQTSRRRTIAPQNRDAVPRRRPDLPQIGDPPSTPNRVAQVGAEPAVA